MRTSGLKVIVIVTITILVVSFLLPFNVSANNGTIQIQIHGAGIGDNLETSAYTFQNSWQWNDTFTIGDNFFKQVDGVFSGDILNVCIINLKDNREDCSSGTFNNDGVVKINIDLG
ncbi:MAG: hypothetical protein ACE5SW_13060 [Nitrososphaeraceae archaeon]